MAMSHLAFSEFWQN